MRNRHNKERRIRTSTVKFIAAGVVIGVFAMTFSFAYAWGEHDKQIETRSGTDVFMKFHVTDFDGQSLTKDDLTDTKLTAYNVWETTCPACIGEMGELEKLSKHYDQSEFRLIGVCADLYDKSGKIKPEQLEKAKQIVSDSGVTYMNIIPDQKMMDFFMSSIPGFPTTFFVDSEGKIVATRAGANNYEGWKTEVDTHLKELN